MSIIQDITTLLEIEKAVERSRNEMERLRSHIATEVNEKMKELYLENKNPATTVAR